MINEKSNYTLIPVDYEACNACSLDTNNKLIEMYGIDDALHEMVNQGFAATKVDMISHSMGGLLIREYCKNDDDSCSSTIRKVITIDTPHLGSELASTL
jgi:triacylglycerol esterase/lipase EstA (alpha/beta hydrolase family)